MAEHVPASWRFVKASDISDGAIDFDGLEVRSSPDESLGSVRGFIVDSEAQRLHYVVVDSGGWFTGGTYLIPPAYTRIDAENEVLWTDLTRDAISRFPQFDADRYPTLSREELWQIERRIITAYGDDPGVVAPSADWERASWRHYEQPTWWRDRSAGATRVADEAALVGDRPLAASAPVGIRRSERDAVDTNVPDAGQAGSPRARPGDVLGLEHGGETTGLGDTAEDEDSRRRRAEEDARELREERTDDVSRRDIAADRGGVRRSER